MAANPEKAKLKELKINRDKAEEKEGGITMTVQFNPETLQVGRSGRKAGGSPKGGNQQRGGGQRQRGGRPEWVGNNPDTLSVDLLFDVTRSEASDSGGNGESKDQDRDVRRFTRKLARLLEPREDEGTNGPEPRGLQFHWGNLQFDGIVDRLDETLELFSSGGEPLRATVSLSMSGRDFFPGPEGEGEGSRGDSVGNPGVVKEGDTVQGLAAREGQRWKQKAEKNGIENPRRPPVGKRMRG